MNTEEACVKISDRQGRGHGRADERRVKPARGRYLQWRSVETLRDLGLSKDKIVAYHRSKAPERADTPASPTRNTPWRSCRAFPT
jgi:hypothetical protein